MDKKTRNPEALRVVRYFGGLTRTAEHFGIKPPSVHAWYEKGIPDARRMYLAVAHPAALRPSRKRRSTH